VAGPNGASGEIATVLTIIPIGVMTAVGAVPYGCLVSTDGEAGTMSDQQTGPVELAVIAFPGSEFNGQIVPALTELVNDGIVQIVDLALVVKGDDDVVTALEITDLDSEVAALFDDLDGEVTGILSEDDLELAGELLEAGSSALVIVWENTWARKFVAAVRDSGGELVAHDRLDAETVAEALAAVPPA
jgi:uncharacterized membrane protein